MFYYLDKNLWNNHWLVIAFIINLVLIIFFRYWLVAIAYKYIINTFTKSKRNFYELKRIQINREVKWSLASSIVAASTVAFCFWMYQSGYTKVYIEIDHYSIAYLCLSPFLLMILNETYYYWLHRFLHMPMIFKIIHKVHHQSTSPTVFTSFSFHPLEALLQFIFFPTIILILPLHYFVLLGVLTFMTLSAVVNHSGIELLKKKYLLKHLIGAHHHDLHHRKFNTNFGLIFTWWDKWMHTEHKRDYYNK